MPFETLGEVVKVVLCKMTRRKLVGWENSALQGAAVASKRTAMSQYYLSFSRHHARLAAILKTCRICAVCSNPFWNQPVLVRIKLGHDSILSNRLKRYLFNGLGYIACIRAYNMVVTMGWYWLYFLACSCCLPRYETRGGRTAGRR